MRSFVARPVDWALVWIAVAVVTLAVPSANAQTAYDCSQVKGRWTGFGWFNFVHEGRERARCTFDVGCPSGPSSGSVDLQCKTPGSKVNAAATFSIKDRRAKGKWKLRNYNVNGTVSGSATFENIDVFLRVRSKEFNQFGAGLKVKVKEGRCRASVRVDVRAPIGLRNIDLALRRC